MKNSYRIKAIASAVACILVTPAAHALDLLRAYESALANDPVFKAAVKEYDSGQANRVIGRAAVMPKLAGGYTRYANNSQVTGPAYSGGPNITYNRAYPSDNLYIQVTQPLFNLEALARIRQGNAQGDMSQAKFVFQSQDLLVRVLQAYTDLLYALDDQKYLVAQRDAYREQLQVDKRLYERGEGTVTDMLETQATYQLSEAKVIEAGNAVEINKRKLEALIGIEIGNPKEVKSLASSFAVTSLVPFAFEVWKDTAIANNAEVRTATHNVEVAKQEYEKQKAGHYPTVNFVGGWNQSKSTNTVAIQQNAVTSFGGVQINIPFSTGGEVTGRTSQARANYEKAQADLEALKEKTITELRRQYDLVISSHQKVDALTKAVNSSNELTKAMRKSVQGGARIHLDVLLADRGQAVAKRNLAQAKYEYMLATLKLRQSAGTLVLEDLEKVAKNFEKDRVSEKVAKNLAQDTIQH